MAPGRRGRPRRPPPPPPSSAPPQNLPIAVGNCTVEIEGGGGFTCETQGDGGRVLISTLGAANITISAVDGLETCVARKPCSDHLLPNSECRDGGEEYCILKDHAFVVLNPKDIDSRNQSLIQEVLRIYMKELPSMNYAANTGKQSLFLEKCVSGKYKTLILRSNSIKGLGEVVAAVSYQIIPCDMQYAEIPLAAVSSEYQRKGIGHLLYSELRNRLQDVGILTIFCWADKESKRFWLKQGFASIGDVDGKGRVRKLPVRADIRKTLCFPGDSTLMVSHLKNGTAFPDRSHEKTCVSVHHRISGFAKDDRDQITLNSERVNLLDPQSQQNENTLRLLAAKVGCLAANHECNDFPPCGIKLLVSTHMASGVSDSRIAENVHDDSDKNCSHLQKAAKRCIWEASLSSIKSKRVRGGHTVDCSMVSGRGSPGERYRGENVEFGDLSLDDCDESLADLLSKDVHPDLTVRTKDVAVQNLATEDFIISDLVPSRKDPKIMFMNIADENKKTCLTKIVQELGGSVTADGSFCTHVITGKARKTLNFCTALCSGAWIVSSSWLKESFREGMFLGESKFILEDVDYTLKYKSTLKDAVIKARAKPQSLLKGYSVCLGKHVQPPANILSIIVKSAGGNVIHRLSNVREPSTAIFIACEEDMEEAMLAAKRGICTYSSDWFMSCVMRQELDFVAPQFAESL